MDRLRWHILKGRQFLGIPVQKASRAKSLVWKWLYSKRKGFTPQEQWQGRQSILTEILSLQVHVFPQALKMTYWFTKFWPVLEMPSIINCCSICQVDHEVNTSPIIVVPLQKYGRVLHSAPCTYTHCISPPLSWLHPKVTNWSQNQVHSLCSITSETFPTNLGPEIMVMTSHILRQTPNVAFAISSKQASKHPSRC